MKLLRDFLTFWKTDIINKLIVLVSLALVAGGLGFAFLVFNTPQSIASLTDSFSDLLPARATPTFDVSSYLTPKANIPAMLPPATATGAPVAVPTFTAYVPLPLPPPTLASEAATSAPTLPPPPTQTAQPAFDGWVCVPGNPAKTGKVVEVLDGYTVRALVDKLVYVIRYIGVVAVDGKYAEAAKQANNSLVYGKDIILIQDVAVKDDRGRLVAYVKTADAFVNFELLKRGLASAVDTPPNSACAQIFAEAEQAARAARLGAWEAVPTP